LVALELPMSDLPYILAHPLLRQILQRCAELKEVVRGLPEDSTERLLMERRIVLLEQYMLPKPIASEQQTDDILDDSGRKIGKRGSLRHRFKPTRRGRPEEWRIKVRAALEDKLAKPSLTWQQLATRYGFAEVQYLRRQVRLLKAQLRTEGIQLPGPSDYREASVHFSST
jgi:hypothetical protein